MNKMSGALWLRWVSVGCLSAALTACGGDDDAETATPPAPPPAAASDAADGSVTAGKTVLTSFKDGVSGWSVVDTQGTATAGLATVSMSESDALATEGKNAARVAVTGAATQAYISWTPGAADWSGKRYLKVDMAATGGIGYVKLATKSGAGYVWCDSGMDGPSKADPAAAKTSAATVTFDLDALTCYGGNYDPTSVKQLMLWVDGTGGTYTIDNLRLESAAAPTANDVANGTTVGSELVLLSFKADVAPLAAYDQTGADAPTLATVALGQANALATEGANVAVITVPNAADKGYVGGTPPVANWAGYRYFKADMAATGGIGYAKLATKSGSGYTWCDFGGDGPTKSDPAGNAGKTAMATVTFDLNALTCYGGTFTPGDVKHFMLWVEGSGGTYTLDNVRLTN